MSGNFPLKGRIRNAILHIHPADTLGHYHSCIDADAYLALPGRQVVAGIEGMEGEDGWERITSGK